MKDSRLVPWKPQQTNATMATNECQVNSHARELMTEAPNKQGGNINMASQPSQM